MKITHTKLIALALSISSSAMWGQIKEEQLILERKKTPNVKRIEKKKTSIPIVKNYPPEEKSAEKIEYTITNIPLVSDFKTSQIQGEDMSPNLISEKYTNYARLGVGNYTKIVADGSFNHRLSETFDLVTQLNFAHTNGLTNDYAWDSHSRDLNINGGVNGYFEKGKLNVTLGAEHAMRNYYGIYALQPQGAIDNLAQSFTKASFRAHYDHYNNNILNDISLKASSLADVFGSGETEFQIGGNLSKHALPLGNNGIALNIDAGVNAHFLANSFQLFTKTRNNYFQASVEPRFTFFKGKSKVMLGSTFSALNGEATVRGQKEQANKTLWFPQAEVSIEASPAVQFFVGVKGGIQQNTFSKLFQQVPFLISDQETRPTQEKYHLYFGLSGDVQQKLTYSASFGMAKMENILHFGANSLYDTEVSAQRKGYDYANTFTALYADGNINQFKLALEYVPLQNLTLKGDVQYLDYKLNNDVKILNRPSFTASFGASYSAFEKKLLLGAKGFVVGSRETNAFSFTENGGHYTATEAMQKLPAYFDFNLSAEYQVHKNFSLFLMGDNLLNKKYETVIGYKVLGAQVMGGVKVKF